MDRFDMHIDTIDVRLSAPSTPLQRQTILHTMASLLTVSRKKLLGTESTLFMTHYSSISASEIFKFSAMAETWWDCKGPFKPLHMMNPTRISFIRSVLCRHFKKDSCCAKPFEGLSILDVGCGGGLLCEPLARLGAEVVGIDAVEKNIKIAAAHAFKDPATASIKYICTTSDELASEGYGEFDAVISLEVPKGTHEWSKFVTPNELALLMDHGGLKLQEMAGMVFNPITGKWSLSTDTSVNYIAYGTKLAVAMT